MFVPVLAGHLFITATVGLPRGDLYRDKYLDSLVIHQVVDVFNKVRVREVLREDQRVEVDQHIVSAHHWLHHMQEERYCLRRK